MFKSGSYDTNIIRDNPISEKATDVTNRLTFPDHGRSNQEPAVVINI